MEHQLVVFELAEEFYGIDIAMVESIIKVQAITQLPQTPAYIKGVTNLRGTVLSVVDLRSRFDLEAQTHTKQTRIIVVTLGSIKTGIVVDGVSEVLRVAAESIEPLPAMINSVNAAFLRGIVRVQDRLIILLDVERVLQAEEQKVLASLPTTEPAF